MAEASESRRDEVTWHSFRPAGRRICSDLAAVLWCKLCRDRKRKALMIKALRLRHGMLRFRNQGPMKPHEDCRQFSAFLTMVLIRE